VLILRDGRLLEAFILASAGLSYADMARRTGHSPSTMRRRAMRAALIIENHYQEDHREYT
jgi:DNA-directed RNA polymerase specialized sigma24 family protein